MQNPWRPGGFPIWEPQLPAAHSAPLCLPFRTQWCPCILGRIDQLTRQMGSHPGSTITLGMWEQLSNQPPGNSTFLAGSSMEFWPVLSLCGYFAYLEIPPSNFDSLKQPSRSLVKPERWAKPASHCHGNHDTPEALRRFFDEWHLPQGLPHHQHPSADYQPWFSRKKTCLRFWRKQLQHQCSPGSHVSLSPLVLDPGVKQGFAMILALFSALRPERKTENNKLTKLTNQLCQRVGSRIWNTLGTVFTDKHLPNRNINTSLHHPSMDSSWILPDFLWLPCPLQRQASVEIHTIFQQLI